MGWAASRRRSQAAGAPTRDSTQHPVSRSAARSRYKAELPSRGYSPERCARPRRAVAGHGRTEGHAILGWKHRHQSRAIGHSEQWPPECAMNAAPPPATPGQCEWRAARQPPQELRLSQPRPRQARHAARPGTAHQPDAAPPAAWLPGPARHCAAPGGQASPGAPVSKHAPCHARCITTPPCLRRGDIEPRADTPNARYMAMKLHTS